MTDICIEKYLFKIRRSIEDDSRFRFQWLIMIQCGGGGII